MIITCNCGLKKFSLPDNSIPAAGRMVQCGSCGLKWKQFPVNEINNTEPISNIKNIASEPKQVQPKRQKVKKVKKTSVRKSREIDLYSPEYLAKKHGIKIGGDEVKNTSSNEKISLGFYNSLLLFVVLIIFLSSLSSSGISKTSPILRFFSPAATFLAVSLSCLIPNKDIR